MALLASCARVVRLIIPQNAIPNILPRFSNVHASGMTSVAATHISNAPSIAFVTTRAYHTSSASTKRRSHTRPSKMTFVSSRSNWFQSPIVINQSAPIFMTLSRRQWQYLFGGLFVIAVTSVQQMQVTAVRKLPDEAGNVATKSESDLELFLGKACLYGLTNGRVILARSERVVRMVCQTLASPDLGPRVKSMAALVAKELILEEKHGRELVLKHLKIERLCNDTIESIKRVNNAQLIEAWTARSFNIRPPRSPDEESEPLPHLDNVELSLPVLCTEVLAQVAQDPATHAQILKNPEFLPTILSLPYEDSIGQAKALLMYNLSRSTLGRKSLYQAGAIKNATDQIPNEYEQSHPHRFVRLYLYGMMANLAQDASHSQLLSIDPSIHDQISNFDLDQEIKFSLAGSWFMTGGLAALFASVYVPIRSFVRVYFRGSAGMTRTQMLIRSTARGIIGAPLFVALAYAADTIKSKFMTDDRLFVTHAALGTTALLFSTRMLITAAPFTIVPALFAGYLVWGPNRATIDARKQRLEEVQRQWKPKSVADEI